MLVDVHCHLTDEAFKGRVKEVVEEARRAGVAVIVTSGLGPRDALEALRISDHQTIYPSIGVMPYELEGYGEVLELVRREAGRLAAIGEVGLDYYWGARETRELQRRVFLEFIQLSLELDLPLVVHSRSAGKYALEVLMEGGAEQVIMHAFDGSASHAERGAQRGFFFSIPPSVFRSLQKQKLVKRLPLENLLLESDSPVLAPNPGKMNVPANVRVSAEWISRLKGTSFERVEEATTENALQILRIRRV